MKSLSANAKDLAQAHRRSDPETTVIKFFPAPRANEILLLEVSKSAPTTGEVLPFGFPSDPTNGVDYRSTVILLSPQEWQEVQSGKMALPPEWDLAAAEDL